ncbi:hypothetical protein [Streptomyces sp. 4R-3d]|uniref:hypothetical protein n=1 Tax=Streptomyces sp. 4R-3d TaxID=2559605 RepID=UPI001071BF9F|nr:hypothetical protein [Streptomyces sp. 4R-3d]TFI30182.1 hypothetical protein E4P36_05400 [Streptomyces sp. 4R-3d]
MDIPWSQIATFSTAGLSAVAAIGAWRAAHRSAGTAHTIAAIERARRLEERRPQIECSLHEPWTDGQAILKVDLIGPDSLGQLDALSVRVDNDDAEHILLTPGGGVTQADYDAHIWGPFRFSPGINDSDAEGRNTAEFPMTVGRGRPFAMERTRPGHWMTGKTYDDWQNDYRNEPVRLVITCRLGEDAWVLSRRIPNPPQ